MKQKSRLLLIIVALIAMLLAGCNESGGENKTGTILDKTAATHR